MIDPSTQEELQAVSPESSANLVGESLELQSPTIDEAQAQSEAEMMDKMLNEYQGQEVQAGSEEAGLISEISKFGSKLLGKEVTDVATDKASKEAVQQIKPMKGSDALGIAKKLISKEQVKPQPQAKPAIGEMVIKAKKAMPTNDMMQVKRVDNFEKGNTVYFNDIDPEKEMLGLRTSDIDAFNTEDAWQLNFDTIRDEDDLASTLAYMAENNQAMIQAERGEAVTNEQMINLAKDIGADPDFINNVLTWENGGALPTAGYVMAIRQTLDASAVKLRRLAMIPENELSPKDRADFMAQYDFHRRFQSKFMGVRAELSRSFRAIGVPYQDEDLASFLAHAEAGLDLKDLRNKIANTETTQGINQVLGAYNDMGKYGADLFYTSYMASILSGLGTQFLVAFGGASNMASRIVERKVASYMPSFKGGDDVAREEFDVMMAAYKSNFLDGMKAFWKTFKTGEAYKGIGSFGEYQDLPLPSEQFKLKGVAAGLADFTFKGTQFMMRNVMGGTDAFFRVLNERAELSMLAYREAKGMVDAGKIMPEQFEATMRGLLENPHDKLKQESEVFAREIGMQERAGDIAKKANDLVKSVPSARYIVPFINTLSNNIRQTIGERTPIAVVRKKFWEDINAGGARGQMALTKLGVGTGYAMVAYGLADSGKLTGALPNDQASRDAWNAAGIKPYSVVFDNDDGTKSYVSYQGIEPFATIFGVVASLSQHNHLSMYQELTKDQEQKMNNIYGDVLYALSETTLNKTFASGLQNFFDSFQSPAQMEKMLASWMNGVIPMAGLRRNIVKELDEIKRDSDGLWEHIQSQIPGLSDDITPVLDLFGQDKTHEINTFRWKPLKSTDDPVYQEIVKLNETVGRVAIGEFTDQFGGQSATPQDRYRWAVYSRRDRTNADGNTLYEVISDIIQKPYYQEAISIDKVRIISSTIKQWDTSALLELANDDPELYEKLSAKKAAREALYQIEKEGKTLEEGKQIGYEKAMDSFQGGLQ